MGKNCGSPSKPLSRSAGYVPAVGGKKPGSCTMFLAISANRLAKHCVDYLGSLDSINALCARLKTNSDFWVDSDGDL